MDPDKALMEMLERIASEDYEGFLEAANDLYEWMANGGFKPDVRPLLAAPDMLAELKRLVVNAEHNPFLSVGHFVEHASHVREALAQAKPSAPE